jgi:hypothetical protein
VQKLWAQETKEKEREAERDRWFSEARPLIPSTKTWKEKRIQKEEEADDSGSENEVGGEGGVGNVEINMVFQLPLEFCLPERETAQLALGAERAIF